MVGVRACDLIGGALRESIPFASYLFYRYGNEANGFGDEFGAEELVAEAKRQKQLHGFKSHKLKGGVFYARPAFCTDNGAMIAYAGCQRLLAGQHEDLSIKVQARWPMEQLPAL